MASSESESSAYYDALSGDWPAESAAPSEYLKAIDDVVVEQARQHESRWILDIGCGDGRRSLGLAARTGANVVGLDASSAMVAAARSVGLQAEVRDISLAEATEGLEPARFDMVTALWNVLEHIESSALRHTALTNVKACLSPGGIAVIDVNNRHNAKAYGWRNVLRNLALDATGDEGRGDFPVSRNAGGSR